MHILPIPNRAFLPRGEHSVPKGIKKKKELVVVGSSYLLIAIEMGDVFALFVSLAHVGFDGPKVCHCDYEVRAFLCDLVL